MNGVREFFLRSVAPVCILNSDQCLGSVDLVARPKAVAPIMKCDG